jgi:hypothetical protein
MAFAFFSLSETSPRPLTEADAIDIWIARWLNIRRIDLVRRYRCDPRRLYEIWEGSRFPGSREKAKEVFEERHPGLLDRVDFGPHRRISRNSDPGQLSLFEENRGASA